MGFFVGVGLGLNRRVGAQPVAQCFVHAYLPILWRYRIGIIMGHASYSHINASCLLGKVPRCTDAAQGMVRAGQQGAMEVAYGHQAGIQKCQFHGQQPGDV